jgi:hypothetical protein
MIVRIYSHCGCHPLTRLRMCECGFLPGGTDIQFMVSPSVLPIPICLRIFSNPAGCVPFRNTRWSRTLCRPGKTLRTLTTGIVAPIDGGARGYAARGLDLLIAFFVLCSF